MKNIRRFAAFAVVATVLMSTCLVAFAKDREDDLPTAANCTITVGDETMTVSGTYTATTSYAITDKELDFALDSTGLMLNYTTPGGNAKTIRLGKQVYAFTVSGALDSLTLSDTLDYHYAVTVDAKIGQMTAKGDVNLTLTGSSAIGTLTIESDKAVVTAESGAEIQATNRALDSDTYLAVAARSYLANTDQASYDKATGVLTLQAAQSGCTVKEALKDVVLTVRKKHGDLAVSGQWYWPNLDDSSTSSGRYLYRFTPTEGSSTHQLTVVFTAAES